MSELVRKAVRDAYIGNPINRKVAMSGETGRGGGEQCPDRVSPVTGAEVWRGVRAPEADTITSAFAALTCIRIVAIIGQRAGEHLARFHKSHAMELGGALIAATASVHDLRLWTRNKKHFPVRDLLHF